MRQLARPLASLLSSLASDELAAHECGGEEELTS